MTQHDKYADLSRLPIAEAEAFRAGMRAAMEIANETRNIFHKARLPNYAKGAANVWYDLADNLAAREGKKP